MTSPMFKRSAEVGWIVAKLRELGPKETISYEELSRVAGEDVRSKPWMLNSARNVLRAEDQVEFDVERGIGLIRCDSIGAADVVEGRARRVTSAARKGLKVSTCVHVPDLPPEKKTMFLSRQAYLALASAVGKAKKMRRLEAAVAVKQKQLSMHDMLEALRENTEES